MAAINATADTFTRGVWKWRSLTNVAWDGNKTQQTDNLGRQSLKTGHGTLLYSERRRLCIVVFSPLLPLRFCFCLLLCGLLGVCLLGSVCACGVCLLSLALLLLPWGVLLCGSSKSSAVFFAPCRGADRPVGDMELQMMSRCPDEAHGSRPTGRGPGAQ